VVAATHRIDIKLPANRNLLGDLAAIEESTGKILLGPTICLGRSDNLFAQSNSNPKRNPLQQGGDTPAGSYVCSIEKLINPDESTIHSYGPYGKIHLQPFSGDALTASRPPYNRSGLCIHSGPLNPAYTYWKGLRPTHGCIRVTDEDMLTLLTILSTPTSTSLVCNIISLSSAKTNGGENVS
jgi:hypothetical protein